MFGDLGSSIVKAFFIERAVAEKSVQNRGPQLAGVFGLFLGLTWIFTGLRVYVRLLLSKNWAADDTVLIVSLLSFTLFCASSFAGIVHGTGKHVVDIPIKDVPTALMYWWACELLYTMTTVLLRLSMAIFLLRICVKKLHKMIIYVTMIVVILFSTFYFFLVLFQCKPVDYFWSQYAGAHGSCLPPQWVANSTLTHSAISATADWILGILPVFLLKGLQMNIRTKLSVGAVMSLGVLAGIATIIRIPFVRVLLITDDFLFATVDVAIWSAVEPGVGIVAAATLALRPLFKKFYGLSSNGTTKAKTQRSPSGHKSQATGHITRKLSDSSDNYDRLDDDAVELELAGSTSIVGAASTGNHKKGVSFFLNKSRSSTSSTASEEEKGNAGWQVQVKKTVEIHSHNRESTGSLGSTHSNRATPWRERNV